MFSVKSPIFHAWTPNMNIEYVGTTWQLSVEDKASSRFSEDITDLLAPGLSELEYDHEIRMPSKPALLNQLKTTIKKNIKRALPNNFKVNNDTSLHVAKRDLWNKVVLHNHEPLWSEFFKEDEMKTLINQQPGAKILWNLATIELVKYKISN